jgi:hypothetical protein
MLMLAMEERGEQDAEKETCPSCHRSRSLYRVRVVGGVMSISIEEEKK